MAITKEQWTGIENALKRGLVINFTHDGHEILLQRGLISETKVAYAVYIDGDIPRFWLKDDEAGFNPLVEVYFRKITYKPWQKFINQIS
ncbi:hypothetical protein, partial [Rahnella sp. ChDrAdgB13]|uniref:hypothetical protein n=1 Tax=Rahnella sp. ChDrAdgB13 TaxID=1850581 RepID=UPI001AD89992